MVELGVIRDLRPLLARYRGVLSAMLGVGLLAALAEGVGLSLFIPLFYSLDPSREGFESAAWLGRTLDALLAPVPEGYRLPVLGSTIFGLVLLKNALLYANGMLYSWVYARVGHQLRMQIMEQWLTVRMDHLEGQEGGRLLDTLKTQTWETIGSLVRLVTLAIRFLTLLVFLGLLLLISWRLTLLVAGALLAFTTLVQFVTRRVKELSDEGVTTHETLAQHMMELVRGMRTIRLFGREEDERARFADVSGRLSRVHLRRDLRAHLIQPLTETLVALLLIVIFLMTARLTADLASVLTFLIILYRMYPHVKEVDVLRFAIRDAHAPVRATMNAVATEGKPYLASGRLPAAPLREGITFDTVSYRYGSAEPLAITDLSTTIPAGTTTALVGPSGAGKSTFIHLLLRLFDPVSGEIRLDGCPLPAMDVASWRRRVAVVSQDVHLFNASVRENIAYGRPDASAAEVEAAAARAHADAFIRAMPDGFETVIGDNGVRLSGGQRQRIALARALIRKPDVFILDEATNALDSLAEQAIQEALAELQGRHTVLVIAHRLTTIRSADRVLVLDGGRLVEEGRFEDLVERGGLFSRMYELQRPAPATTG